MATSHTHIVAHARDTNFDGTIHRRYMPIQLLYNLSINQIVFGITIDAARYIEDFYVIPSEYTRVQMVDIMEQQRWETAVKACTKMWTMFIKDCYDNDWVDKIKTIAERVNIPNHYTMSEQLAQLITLGIIRYGKPHKYNKSAARAAVVLTAKSREGRLQLQTNLNARNWPNKLAPQMVIRGASVHQLEQYTDTAGQQLSYDVLVDLARHKTVTDPSQLMSFWDYIVDSWRYVPEIKDIAEYYHVWDLGSFDVVIANLVGFDIIHMGTLYNDRRVPDALSLNPFKQLKGLVQRHT